MTEENLKVTHKPQLFHVGKFLRQSYLWRYNWQIPDVARHLRLSEAMVRKILTGERRLSVEIAKRIEKVFGINACDLLCMQTQYELSKLRESDYIMYDSLPKNEKGN